MRKRCILLLLAANSVDCLDSGTVDEIRKIEKAIQSATHRDLFERFMYSGLRVSDIGHLLKRHKPHVLHISGHARKSEGLVIEDDNSQVAKIRCEQLVNLILSSTPDARHCLVFFSFCRSELCATGITAKVPYAVGVRGEISDKSLQLFTEFFYDSLATGESVRGAFDGARSYLESNNRADAHAMVLRVQHGVDAEEGFLSSMGFLERSVAEALRIHRREIFSRYFEEPVWSQEGLTLDKSYVDLECGSLTWGDITESVRKGEGFALDPFDELSAPRTDLLSAALDWLEKENLPEFLVIQGSPGAGKSSFTLRLAVEMTELGYQPVRVRLRDLGLGTNPIAEIGKILNVRYEELEAALEEDKTRVVLILDGWDELTLVGNENLTDRVGTFLESIRAEVLVRWQGRVPVILTGRPTKAVTTERNMTQNTRILTIYRFSPLQLRQYLVKLDAIYSKVSKISPDLDIILHRYEDDWKLSQGVPSSQVSGTTDVIGWPLLAHVAYRLMLACDPSRLTSLIGNRTMLLRCLTEYYCIHSRNPSDDPAGSELRSRLGAYELRSLVQETAIALTVQGTECISQEELEYWLRSPDTDRNVKLTSVDADVFLINYLFKSGVEYLGCEFIHKSLREFSFAEGVVDNLKRLANRSNTKGRYVERNFITEARLPILSRQWLGREIWAHIEGQITWEICRESPKYEDPSVFQRKEKALGIDAWCRIRDTLAEVWHDWVLYNTQLPPLKSDLEFGDVLKGVRTIDNAVADARFGAALFRLCALVHSVVAMTIIEAGGLMNSPENVWGELGVIVTESPHQTRLRDLPDRRLRFFSPCQSEEELEPSALRAAVARINAHYSHLEEELPERADLSFIVLTKAPLERFSFQYCNLSYSNLAESNLSGANLRGANLSGACFSKADLSRANLSMADLPYASFRQANLEGASLKSCDIEAADFREAKGLLPEQITVTRNWQSAKFDPEFVAKLRELESAAGQPLEWSE